MAEVKCRWATTLTVGLFFVSTHSPLVGAKVSSALIRSDAEVGVTPTGDVRAELIVQMGGEGASLIAPRLRQLSEMCSRDPDEPDIDEGSLATIRDFFNIYGTRISIPQVSVSPKGHFVTEWNTGSREREMVAIEFLPDGLLRYVVLGVEEGSQRGTDRAESAAIVLLPYLC